MRGRLSAALVVVTASVLIWSASAARAQTSGGGGGTETGDDQSATGELLPSGNAAEVGAGFVSPRTGGGGNSAAGGEGGSAGSGGITCRFVPHLPGGGPGGYAEATVGQLTALYNDQGRQPVLGLRVCSDASGQIVDQGFTTWAPGAGGPGGPVVVIDPAVLARIARSRLVFPGPLVSTSPPADQGTYAQLPTFFFVENWGDVSEQASAGPVTATVTASPVRQTWAIHDTFRGGTETVSCEGPGAAFDPLRPVEDQLPPACGWTPRHSSAGQRQHGGAQGEACFPTMVTVAWDVRWGSNIGAGGVLGEGTSTTELCLVVAELQAVVDG
jgi:hypothetical protein